MENIRLTVNAIDKLIGNLNGMIVQIISVQEKFQTNQCYYSCDLNDGFCKIKGCIIDSMEKVQKSKLKDFAVIKVLKSAIQKNKKQKLIVIVENYQLVSDKPIKIVGNPISYDEYIKNGKNNPDGDNLVIIQKGAQLVKKQSKIKEYETSDEAKNTDQNTRTNKPISKNLQKNIKTSSNQSLNPPNNQKFNNEKEDSRGTANSLSRDKPFEQKTKPGPIERLQPKRQEQKMDSITSGKQKKPNSQYSQIKSLFVGMQNWIILGRIISLSPIKSFINKKGVQSFILNFELGDKSGLIQCNIFGEIATRFENILKQDQIYQIANGIINQNSYLGVHRLQITIIQNSKVNIKQDDPNIPYMQDFCISVKRLTEIKIGEEARVICLVKDDQEIQNITTKQGKPMRKKIITFCDPIDKIEVDITLWNDSCDFKYERYPYMFKGVLVKQYQGNRQYSLKTNYKAMILKQHNLRKYIKDIENITFSNPDSNNKPKRTAITTIKDLNNAMDEVSKSGTWSQIVCFLTAIRHSAKNFYISCPKCKKKVTETENVTCIHCDHFYQQAKYRYILNMNISDYTDSVWITAYDEPAEKILGINAQQFSKLSQQQLAAHVRDLKYKMIKLRLITKNQEFNNNIRQKTNIIKILDLNYADQAKYLLQKLKNSSKQ